MEIHILDDTVEPVDYGFTQEISPNFGYCESLGEADEIIRNYQEKTLTKFCVCKSGKNFGQKDWQKSSHFISFESERGNIRIPFDGIPFMVIGTKVLQCQHGKDSHKKSKERYKQMKERGEYPPSKKQRTLTNPTKKKDCPATIHLREVVTFPEFQMLKDTARYRRKISCDIRTLLKNDPSKIQMERRIYILLPFINEHRFHIIGQCNPNLKQNVDPQLVEKIYELVNVSGVDSIDEMVQLLKNFVLEIFVGKKMPPVSNKRFYPSKKDIREHMANAVAKLRLSKFQGSSIEMDDKVMEWLHKQPENCLFYQPCIIQKVTDANDDELSSVSDFWQNFCFFYQTREQQRLMAMYGNEICILDASFKLNKCSLPLYFILVRTNVDYQVVATFIVQEETPDALVEVFDLLKDKNNNWSPKYFMIDADDTEINAVKQAFPTCQMYVSDFHREQAWWRWLHTESNGVSMNDVLPLIMQLRSVAESKTIQETEASLNRLTSHPVWVVNKKLQSWFQNSWLRYKERWIWAYRSNAILIQINMRNGIDVQNQQFKHDVLMNKRHLSLVELTTLLIETLLPQIYSRYVELNLISYAENTTCSNNISPYLQNRPQEFTQHCLSQLPVAHDFGKDLIKKIDEKTFRVNSLCGLLVFIVCLGSESEFPSCQCHVWTSTWWPCPHLLALLEHKLISWCQLSSAYRLLPFLKIDHGVLGRENSNNDTSDSVLLCKDPDDSHEMVKLTDEESTVNTSIICEEKTDETLNNFKTNMPQNWEVVIFGE
uniref:Uncharacterized LOC100177403 n=1 Tax=Ciona intestinalis TaxID=7719 RepID=A0A1W3JFQ5_CIOIN|nr:uncharacterized protein LOC100177403 [Ciona intestinalis]|eukprot:XP_009857571.1 uncharacterized protein LOC100177403 [Ciona intestinalis]